MPSDHFLKARELVRKVHKGEKLPDQNEDEDDDYRWDPKAATGDHTTVALYWNEKGGQKDWEYLNDLSVRFQAYQERVVTHKKDRAERGPSPPKPRPGTVMSKQDLKRKLSGIVGKYNFTAKGDWLNHDFISDHLEEIKTKKSDEADEDEDDKSTVSDASRKPKEFIFRYGDHKLFKKFCYEGQERTRIIEKFVDALVTHPQASQITEISITRALLPDEFVQVLARRLMEERPVSEDGEPLKDKKENNEQSTPTAQLQSSDNATDEEPAEKKTSDERTARNSDREKRSSSRTRSKSRGRQSSRSKSRTSRSKSRARSKSKSRKSPDDKSSKKIKIKMGDSETSKSKTKQRIPIGSADGEIDLDEIESMLQNKEERDRLKKSKKRSNSIASSKSSKNEDTKDKDALDDNDDGEKTKKSSKSKSQKKTKKSKKSKSSKSEKVSLEDADDSDTDSLSGSVKELENSAKGKSVSSPNGEEEDDDASMSSNESEPFVNDDFPEKVADSQGTAEGKETKEAEEGDSDSDDDSDDGSTSDADEKSTSQKDPSVPTSGETDEGKGKDFSNSSDTPGKTAEATKNCEIIPHDLLPNLQVLDLETNYITEPGIEALSQIIKNDQVCRFLQVLKLEGQKRAFKNTTEETLGEAVRRSPSLVVVSLKVQYWLPRNQIHNTCVSNLDHIRQARIRYEAENGGTPDRKRNEMERYFDQLANNELFSSEDDAATNMESPNRNKRGGVPTVVDLGVKNAKFMGLLSKEKIKAAKAFATNKHIKTLKMVHQHLDDDFCIALGKALTTNDTLQKVILDSNDISGVGIKAIFEGLSSNKSVSELSIGNQSRILTPEQADELPAILESNTSLTRLGMDPIKDTLTQKALDRHCSRNLKAQKAKNKLLNPSPTKSYIAKVKTSGMNLSGILDRRKSRIGEEHVLESSKGKLEVESPLSRSSRAERSDYDKTPRNSVKGTRSIFERDKGGEKESDMVKALRPPPFSSDKEGDKEESGRNSVPIVSDSDGVVEQGKDKGPVKSQARKGAEDSMPSTRSSSSSSDDSSSSSSSSSSSDDGPPKTIQVTKHPGEIAAQQLSPYASKASKSPIANSKQRALSSPLVSKGRELYVPVKRNEHAGKGTVASRLSVFGEGTSNTSPSPRGSKKIQKFSAINRSKSVPVARPPIHSNRSSSSSSSSDDSSSSSSSSSSSDDEEFAKLAMGAKRLQAKVIQQASPRTRRSPVANSKQRHQSAPLANKGQELYRPRKQNEDSESTKPSRIPKFEGEMAQSRKEKAKKVSAARRSQSVPIVAISTEDLLAEKKAERAERMEKVRARLAAKERGETDESKDPITVRRDRIFSFYNMSGQCSREKLKLRVEQENESSGILMGARVEDVDLLPWNDLGTALDPSEMTKMIMSQK